MALYPLKAYFCAPGYGGYAHAPCGWHVQHPCAHACNTTSDALWGGPVQVPNRIGSLHVCDSQLGVQLPVDWSPVSGGLASAQTLCDAGNYLGYGQSGTSVYLVKGAGESAADITGYLQGGVGTLYVRTAAT